MKTPNRYAGAMAELEQLVAEYRDIMQLEEVRQGVYQVLSRRHGPESLITAVHRFLAFASAVHRGSQDTPNTGVRGRIARALASDPGVIPPAMRDLFHAHLAPQAMRDASLEQWTIHLVEAQAQEISDDTRERLVAAGEMFLEALRWLESPEDAGPTLPDQDLPHRQGGAQ